MHIYQCYARGGGQARCGDFCQINYNNSLFDPIMKNTVRNTILENKLRYRTSKKTIRACLGWTTLV